MTNPTNELEDRLRSALQVETAEIRPGDASLGTIQTRVRSARRRRRTVLAGAGVAAMVAVVVALPRLGEDEGKVDISNEPGAQATTTETPSTTETPTPPAVDYDQALWPDPDGELFTDPVDAARSFVATVIGVEDPPLSDFLEGESGIAEVDVYGRGEDGGTLDRVVATVSVRQLDGEHWFVTAAGSADVQIDDPGPLDQVSSPLHVEGRGHGFDGTIEVELRERSAGAAVIAEDFTTAGSSDALEPFATDLDFEVPTPGIGVLVAHDSSGTEAAVPSFSALPVRLAATSSAGTSGQTTPTSVGPAPAPASEFGYQPLWPFRTQAEADAWRDQYQAQGSQPWHLDAEQTALSFTTGFLGFTEIDRVIARDIGATEAHVTVGYDTEGGQQSPAANIHLVRFGSGDDAPWEVVGTADTDLSVETPGYGAPISSPISVGGHVTGVDENLVVRVHQPSSSGPIGESAGLPAGGENTPWDTSVSFAGATDPALTIVVWTGGHYQGVERFAITGVHR